MLWVRRCCAAAEFSCEIGGLGLYLRGLVIFLLFCSKNSHVESDKVVIESGGSCGLMYIRSFGGSGGVTQTTGKLYSQSGNRCSASCFC
jgi:hypothetical protein